MTRNDTGLMSSPKPLPKTNDDLMQNVEFKAELRDLIAARATCEALRASFICTLHQTDTYYRIAGGKLKKRETEGEETEFIQYERPALASPKVSDFTIMSEAQAAARFGLDSLPVWTVVRKRRELYLHGHTRIHLDQVQGLGTFLEFESLVSAANPVESARGAVAALREAFAPILGEAIDCGYADLLTLDAQDGRAR